MQTDGVVNVFREAEGLVGRLASICDHRLSLGLEGVRKAGFGKVESGEDGGEKERVRVIAVTREGRVSCWESHLAI